MNNLTSITYDVINTDIPHGHTPSKLFSLKPITDSHTESLTSYINRLSCMHHILPRKLIESEYLPYFNKAFDRNISRFCNTGARVINGFSDDAERFVKITEQLTRQNDLADHTLLKWEKMVPKGPNGLNKQHLAWCPYCFQKMKNENKTIYEHLSWTLQSQTYCPDHYLPLSRTCPECESKQPLFSHSQIGYCHKCYSWLGKKFTSDFPNMDERTYSDFRISCAAGDVADNSKTLESNPTQKNFVRILFSHIETLSYGNVTKFSRDILRLDPPNVYQWLKGNHKPSFDMFMYICSCLGLQPTEFFNNKKSDIEDIGHKVAPPIASHVLRDKLKSDLQIIYSKKYEPISLQGIAKKFGVSVEYLRFNFQDEVKEIRYRYNKKTEEKNKEQTIKLNQTIYKLENIVRDLIFLGIKPTQSQVSSLFKGKLNFKDKNIKAAYDKAVKIHIHQKLFD